MKLTSYQYTGPLSGTSLRVGEEILDVQLIPNQSVDLPADHEYTQVLLHLKQLELPPSKAAKKPSPTEGGAAQ